MISAAFFTQTPLQCSRALIGCELRWGRCRGRIVETEAYQALDDEACHTFMRRGAREFVARHPPGTAYIYLNYGVHWLLNVLVKGGAQEGFVLIRALEPLAGWDAMEKRRGLTNRKQLCSGPGKLTQALGVPATFHGASLCRDAGKAFHAPPPGAPPVEVVTDARIGISRAADLPWRFLLKDSFYVSRRARPLP